MVYAGWMKRALFLHIQKTAGTTIQNAARSYWGNENVISHGDFLRLGQKGCAPFRFVSGHFGFDFARLLMPGRFSFTFLRDPAERLLSLYRYSLGRNPDESPLYSLAQRTDFEGFLLEAAKTPLRAAVWNNQVWQLACGYSGSRPLDDFSSENLLAIAERNLRQFDYVGFLATFDDDAASIFQHLGFGKTAPRKMNVSAAGITVADLSPSARRLLLEFTELDQEFYHHAWRHYGAWRKLRRRIFRLGPKRL